MIEIVKEIMKGRKLKAIILIFCILFRDTLLAINFKIHGSMVPDQILHMTLNLHNISYLYNTSVTVTVGGHQVVDGILCFAITVTP